MRVLFIVFAVALMVALIIFAVSQKMECESKGGILLRGTFGNECVKMERVK